MLEAHAAGNPARDRIELAALRAVYRGPAGHCALGSVKGNVGHLGQAAGVTSLIKVALVAGETGHPGHRRLPAAAPGAGAGRLAVLPARAEPVGWPGRPDRPRLAGVNASDAGGTNVHAIVAEAPAVEPEPVERRPRMSSGRPAPRPPPSTTAAGWPSTSRAGAGLRPAAWRPCRVAGPATPGGRGGRRRPGRGGGPAQRPGPGRPDHRAGRPGRAGSPSCSRARAPSTPAWRRTCMTGSPELCRRLRRVPGPVRGNRAAAAPAGGGRPTRPSCIRRRWRSR